MVAGPTESGTRTPFGLNSGSSEGKEKKKSLSLHSLHGIQPDSESCPVRRRPRSAHTVPRMEIQGQGKKSNISPLGGNLKCATSGFRSAQKGSRDKEVAVVREEREGGKKRVTRAMKDGWE